MPLSEFSGGCGFILMRTYNETFWLQIPVTMYVEFIA